MILIDEFIFNRVVQIRKKQRAKATGGGVYLKAYDLSVFAVVGTTIIKDVYGSQIVSEQQFYVKVADEDKVDVEDLVVIDGIEMPILKKMVMYDVETSQKAYIIIYV